MKDLAKIRSDVVGSLLRPPRLKAARMSFDEGKLAINVFREIEDEEIRAAVRLQEQVGLAVVTDGEYRRLNFQDSFGESGSGFDAAQASLKFYEQRVEGSRPLQRWEIPDSGESKGTAISQRRPVVERLRLTRNTPLEEYRFVSQVAQKPAKVTLIGPDRIAQRFDWQNSTAVYATIDEFTADVVKVEREIIAGLVKKKLIQRISDPEDSRIALLSLTPKGQQKLNEIKAFHDHVNHQVLLQMEPEQRKTMLTNLDLLKASMEAVKDMMI